MRRRPCEFPPRPRRPARRATAPRRRRILERKGLTGPIPTEIGQLTALKELRVPPASADARRAARPTHGVVGSSTKTGSPARSRPRSASSRRCSTCEFPPRPRRPARRATDPRRRRELDENKITGPFPTEFGLLTALEWLRLPPASPTPGAARDRPSASQVPRQQQDQRHDPDHDRPARGAEGPASSPRVPDAWRAA